MIDYDPSYAARARDLCMAGLNEIEIAHCFGFSVGYLRAWREKYPEFDQAWMDGTYHANTKVVAALFKRACGYDKIIWKETQNGMMQELKHIEPNVPACVMWLTNKMPDQWKSKVEHELGGGGSIPVNDLDSMEAARRIAFALSKAIHESRSVDNGDPDVQRKALI